MTRRLLSALLLALLFGGCGGDDDPIEVPAGPGTMTATLDSPNGVEGGALIHLIGAGASSVTAPTGDLWTNQTGDTVKVLLLRETPGDLVLGFNLPDTTQLPQVRILQVTDGANQLRSSLSGYSLRIQP